MYGNGWQGWFCTPDGFGGMFGMGGIMMLIFWVIVLGLIFQAGKFFIAKEKKLAEAGAEDGLAILKQRYAAGKISPETYREMKKDIEEAAI